MADRIVLILAAGEGQRWNGVEVKQLVRVGRDTLIGRTVKMCQDRGVTPIIVSHRPELYADYAPVIAPLEHEETVVSLWASRALWPPGGRIVVLLGDVYYSEACLDGLLKEERPCQFHGSSHEIFGVSFAHQLGATLSLDAVVRRAKTGERGKLWDFYYDYSHTQKTDPPTRTECYTLIEDETQDVDTEISYMQLMRKL